MGQYRNLFKCSAVSGAGFMAGTLIYSLLGMLLFVSGFILYKKETKKIEMYQNDSTKIFGIALMFFGAVFGFGSGMGVALDSLSKEL